MPDIDLLEVKKIIRLIDDKYKFDLSTISTPLLRSKLNRIAESYNFTYPGIFRRRLTDDPRFYEELLFELLNTDLEAFRDPDMWIFLKENLVPFLINRNEKIEIEISLCISGSDLYSVIIFFNELEILEKVKIHYRYILPKHVEKIKRAEFDSNQVEFSLQNIHKVFPHQNANSYFTKKGKYYLFNNTLIENISNSRFDLSSPLPKEVNHLIFCRNKLAFYNLPFQNLILDYLVNALKVKGIILIGYRENISDYLSKHKTLSCINDTENLFEKNKP